MARLWEIMLLWWSCTPLSLPSSVSFIGTQKECQDAQFVPGYNLGGEGFDIVRMRRKGAYVIDTEKWKLGKGTCRLYRNSYIDSKMQKVPVSIVDWRVVPQCSLSVSSVNYDSVESLVSDSTSSVSNDWKVGLEIPTGTAGLSVGGSHSRVAGFGMKRSKRDRYSFFRHSIKCMVYRYRLAAKPPLSHEFESAVSSLPAYSYQTEMLYRNVIHTYGTHYITKVYLGGEIKAVTAVRTCQTTMNGMSTTEVNDCLTVEASGTISSSVTVKAMASHCRAKKEKLGFGKSFSSVYNDRETEVIGGNINGADILFQGQSNPYIYNNWVNSLRTTPDVVQYDIKPLHTILPSHHHAWMGLKREVEKYIKKNAVLKKCSEACKIGHRSARRDPCDCVCNSNQNIMSNCCPAGKGLATLKVFGLYAKSLYGDVSTQTDGSVMVSYGNQIKRTAIILNNDNPYWPETFNFGPININPLNKLTFAIYDEDTYWNSDLLGECSFRLRRGKVKDSCMLNHGTFFFSYKVECAPSLGGDKCQHYMPSSMSPALAKVFHTRNGVLFGKRSLVGQDVALNQSVSHAEGRLVMRDGIKHGNFTL